MRGLTTILLCMALPSRLPRRLRGDQTDAERLLWWHLRDRFAPGFKFRRQHPIGDWIPRSEIATSTQPVAPPRNRGPVEPHRACVLDGGSKELQMRRTVCRVRAGKKLGVVRHAIGICVGKHRAPG